MPKDYPSVFVRGLSFSTNETQLANHFSDIAPVKRAIIVRDKTTHESRGFGFVQFAIQEDAAIAAEKLNGSSLQERTITVTVAETTPSSTSTASTNATLKNKQQYPPTGTAGSKRKRETGSSSTHIPSSSHHAAPVLSRNHPITDELNRRRSVILFGIPSEVDKKRLWKRVRKTKGVQELQYPITLPGNEQVRIAIIQYETPVLRESGYTALNEHTFHNAMVYCRRGEDLLTQHDSFYRSRLIIRNLRFDASTDQIRDAFQRNKVPLITSIYIPLKNGETNDDNENDGADGDENMNKDSNKLKKSTNTQSDNNDDDDDDETSDEFGSDKEETTKTATQREKTKKGPKNRGFAFVEFPTRIDAQNAVTAMNEKRINRRTIAVDWALPKAAYKASLTNTATTEEKATEDDKNETTITSNDNPLAKDKSTTADETADSDNESNDEKNDEDAEEENDVDANNDDDNNNDDDEEDYDDDADNDDDDNSNYDKKVTPAPQKVAEDLGSTLFLRNVTFDTDEKELIAVFRVFGPVHYATLVKDRETGRPKGTAFVKFYTKIGADRALAAAGASDEHSADFRNGDGIFGIKSASDNANTAINTATESTEDKRKRVTYNAAVDAALLAGGIIVGGRALLVRRALSKQEADILLERNQASQGIAGGKKYDNRHTYLSHEGAIRAGTPAAENMPKQDLQKREEATRAKKQKLLSPLFFVSPTRLSIRNLAKHVDDSALRKIARESAEQGLATGLVDRKEGDPRLMPESGKNIPKLIIHTAKILRESILDNQSNTKIQNNTVVPASKGFGFVEFSHHIHALACLRYLNNNPAYSSYAAGGAAAKSKPENERPRLIIEFAIENAAKVRQHEERKAATAAKQRALREMGMDNNNNNNNNKNTTSNNNESKAAMNNEQHSAKRPRSDKKTDKGSSSSSSDTKNKPSQPNTNKIIQSQNTKEDNNKSSSSTSTNASSTATTLTSTTKVSSSKSKPKGNTTTTGNNNEDMDPEFSRILSNHSTTQGEWKTQGEKSTNNRRQGAKKAREEEEQHDRLINEYKQKLFGARKEGEKVW